MTDMDTGGENKVADLYCCNCAYYGGHAEPAWTCNYIFIEDKMRPCPPGKGCTVKIKRKRAKRTKAERMKQKVD